MAGTIRIQTTITIVDDSTSAPTVIQQDVTNTFTALQSMRYALAASGTQSIWDPSTDATEAVSAFTTAILIADGAVDVEFTPDSAGNPSTERLASGIPLMLGSNVCYRTTGFSGALGVINKLRLKEPNAVARKVQLILAS